MDFKFQRKRLNEIPESKILDELELAAKHFNYIEFAWRDFDKIADVSANTVKKHFGSWKKGLSALKNYLNTKGLDLLPRPHAPNRVFSDTELFQVMEKVWQKVGQRPSRTEWELSKPQISYNTYKQRFGGWTNACLKFIEYKMGHSIIVEEPIKSVKVDSKTPREIKYQQENSRNVSLSLRLRVLNRDNFRCIFCGKNPATDIGTRLHIDHIKPFSRGGKSVFENLQTLCEKCNLGKSDDAYKA